MGRVITGLEGFLKDPPVWAARSRLGLLAIRRRWPPI